MSRDSSFTYVHFRASHHADLFEEFCHPPSASNTNSNNDNASSTKTDPSDPSLAHIPGHFMPFESINLPPHLMPINPEDEDGVVPDMHAAYGITRAMNQSGAPEQTGEQTGRGITPGRDPTWQDLGLEHLVNGVGGMDLANMEAPAVMTSRGGLRVSAPQPGPERPVRREGRRNGVLGLR